MQPRERKIIVLNFIKEGAVQEERIDFGGVRFSITEHPIGWDFKTAEMLIKKYDEYVDGFALSGVQKKAVVGRTSVMHPGYLMLMRAAIKAPIYLADDVRDFFADWTVQRLLKEQPQLFSGRRVLFQCAMISPWLKKISEAGANVQGADALITAGMPLRLNGTAKLERYLKTLSPVLKTTSVSFINPEKQISKLKVQSKLDSWIRESDIFVGFANLMDRMISLNALEGKIVFVDYLSKASREKLSKVKVAQIIEFIPELPNIAPMYSKHFSLLAALIDQRKIAEDSPLSFDEYILKWIQELNIKPNRLQSTSGVLRRCAFVIHALSQNQLFKNGNVPFMSKAPETIRNLSEYAAARIPIWHYGTLTGAKSKETGQEVICDLYAMAATPKQLLKMDEDFVYKRLADGAELAKENGAAMMGLGAYTKVVGDAGVTVSKLSPIPVTNGNSYSAAATLWAARVMTEKMGFVKLPTDVANPKMRAKAMVIGATGSIGRVSSLLVSLAFDELVLVATRPDKLLELRQEILELSPKTKVTVTTNPNPELPTTDLIVTATSNQGGDILDIMQVKPGAVICDCSRPLDIGPEQAAKRPDVMVIESGEIDLPGNVQIDCSIGLPKPSVYACLAETVLLTMEGRYESYSLSKQLSMEKVKEIYKLGLKHGAALSTICGPNGVITEEHIEECKKAAGEKLKMVPQPLKVSPPGHYLNQNGEMNL
jgi:predicted amino acid dehydrogenase